MVAGPIDGAYVTDRRPDDLKAFSSRFKSLRIQMLGGLSAQSAAGQLAGEAAQPRRLALLALLARAGSRGVSRDKLVGYLWPETDEERARRTLSQALYSLRQGMDTEELFLGTQELRLNPAVISSDLDDFTTARRDGNWARAAELYGGPFLDGFHLPGAADFESWVEAERDSLGHEYAELLERLATVADQSREYRSAAGWWRRLAALDPLNARIAMCLMRSLAAAGDRSAAVRHARVYQSLVEQELDMPADREVVALAERIRTEPAQTGAPPQPPITAPALPDTSVPETAVSVAPTPGEVTPAQPALARPVSRHTRMTVPLVALVALISLLALLWVRRARNRVSAADPLLLMVGRITDYGGGSANGIGRPLADMIATDLARAPRLRVISNARVYELLAQLRVSDTVATGMMSAARHAGATELLDGALFDLGGGRIRLDLRRVEVATGAVLGAYTVQGSDPFSLADSVTAQLVAALGVSAPVGLIADLTTRSLDAYRAYEAGLQAYYRLDFPAAEGHFADALRADSTFAMASYYFALASSDRAVGLGRLNVALRRGSHASDRERLIIAVAWALNNAAPNGLALAETLAVRYPAEVDGHLALGAALFGAEDFLGGIRSFSRVIAMDSVGLRGGGVRCAACDAYESLIAGYSTLDSMAAAQQAARAWAAAQPSNPVPLRLLAIMADRLRDTAAGSRYYRRADALDTSSANRHAYYTVHLWWSEDFAGMERADSVRLGMGISRSERIDVLWDMVLAQAQQGRFAAALEVATALRREVAAAGQAERDGHPLAITVGLAEAQALRQTGRLRGAAARFDSLSRFDLAASPPSARASAHMWIYTHLASTLSEAGDTIRLAEVAARMDSLKGQTGKLRDLKYPHYAKGLLQSARGNTGVAYAEFEQASSEAIDGFGLPTLEMARMDIRLGRPREAVARLQRLLLSSYHFYITHTEQHAALAEAWVAAGNRDSARVHLQAVDRAWVAADPPVKARLAELHQRLAID